MGSPPRKSAVAPKKAAARKRGTIEGVQVETLLNNASIKVTRTTMQPGAEIPAQTRLADYVIFPVTEFSCVRRFVAPSGRVTREVALSGTPGRPYFGRATKAGRDFVLVNNSRGVIVFDKVVIKRSSAD